MPEDPPCDCERAPAWLALDCQIINDAWRLLGGRNGAEPTPTAPAVSPQLPQPLLVQAVRPCRDYEDPDLRPYIWECDHD